MCGSLESSERISVLEAARILGMAPCTVRYFVKTGQLPIGYCMKSKSGKTNRVYIFRQKLEMYVGGEINGERICQE